jgi:hypothetical protein
MTASATAVSSSVREAKNSRVAAQAQHLAFDGHEHALAVGIQCPVCLVGEQRRVATPRMRRQIQSDGASQARLHPGTLAAAHQTDSLGVTGLAVVHEDVEALLLLALASLQ